jgi:hypothetical protein
MKHVQFDRNASITNMPTTLGMKEKACFQLIR